MLFLIISLLVGTAMSAITEEITNEPLNIIKAEAPAQCQNIQMQQRQIFEKMTRIENQLDAKGVID